MVATPLALGDFDSYDGATGAAAVITDPLTGFDDTSALFVTRTNADDVRLLVPTDASGVTKGITVGEARMTFKRSSASVVCMYGLTIAHSADNVAASGNCYSLAIYAVPGEAHRLRLAKHTSGLSTNGTALAYYEFAESTSPMTIKLVWQLTATAAYFEAFLGTALDYTGMTSRISTIDVSSPLTTSAAEGWFFRNPATATVFNIWADNLQVDELV